MAFRHLGLGLRIIALLFDHAYGFASESCIDDVDDAFLSKLHGRALSSYWSKPGKRRRCTLDLLVCTWRMPLDLG